MRKIIFVIVVFLALKSIAVNVDSLNSKANDTVKIEALNQLSIS